MNSISKEIIDKLDLLNYTQKVEGWDDLTPQQQTILALAIEETNDLKNLVQHEDVLKMMDNWLTK